VEGPKCVFTSISYVLIGSKFKNLFYLSFGDLRIIPKIIRFDAIYSFDVVPSVYMRKISGKFF
jgi:hypothetical protein